MPSTLENLPFELIVAVATCLGDGPDFGRFASACKRTREASKYSGGWRSPFVSKFDLPPDGTAFLWAVLRQRRTLLSKPIDFCHGTTTDERIGLRVIRDLVIESFSDNGRDSSGERVSKNVTFLRDVVCQSKLLQYVLGRNARENGATTLLQAIQLLFAHWSLEFSLDCPTHGFMTSRKVVYSHRKTWLMFEGRMLSVNIELLLHIANFFKYHLTNEYEATLFNHFQELPEDQKPRAWNGPLETGVRQIGTSWKGSYAYLHDTSFVRKLRSENPRGNIFIDTLDYEDGFQTLELNFDQAGCGPWPWDYERHLHALPPRRLASAVQNHPMRIPVRGLDYLVFTGTGVDAARFTCSGVLHGLPEQVGIPGWQRISMMKCIGADATPSSSASADTAPATAFDPYAPAARELTRLDGTVEDNSIQLDNNNYWAYEGVVLPGGMMMLGRWWSPIDDNAEYLCTGPFIFWNVPDQQLLTS